MEKCFRVWGLDVGVWVGSKREINQEPELNNSWF